jgi:radical SAM protein with 4Fe4S-binding SPASM domain
MSPVRKIWRKIMLIEDLILRRPKGWFDFILSLLSYVLRSSAAFGRPVHITIEPANICNLQCPVCETGAGQLKRPKGQLSLARFRQFIEQVRKHTNTILFYFMGEPFLNKEAYEMITFAREQKIFVTTCTNGEFVDPVRLIGTGLNEISFQIGGLTQGTHSVYRVGSDLEKIKINIKALAAEKKKHNGTVPKIVLGFIVMKHNEKELPALDSFARELGVDEVQVISPCVRTMDQAQQFLPEDRKYWFYDENKLKQGILAPRIVAQKCPWIYFSTTILWNGDVVPCCRDAQGEMVMGNIFETNLDQIWNNSKYQAFRRQVLTPKGKPSLCRLCSGYGVPDLW